VTAHLVEVESIGHDNYPPISPNSLIGASTSSLHRLKDVNNKGERPRAISNDMRAIMKCDESLLITHPDGGFFVFGDMSCRKEGLYRLQFSLFELKP